MSALIVHSFYRIVRALPVAVLLCTLTFANTVFGDVPFPFGEENFDGEFELVSETVVHQPSVPIPPDTLGQTGWENAEGYVPRLYGPAPSPDPNLRPRYRHSNGMTMTAPTTAPKERIQLAGRPQSRSGAAKSSVVTASGSVFDSIPPAPPAAETTSPEPIMETEELTAPAFLTVAPQMEETSVEPNQSEELLAAPASAPSDTFASPSVFDPDTGTFVSDTFAGDESNMVMPSLSSSRHLSSEPPHRGLCRCCGLLTCPNKTRGRWFVDGWVSVGAFLNTHQPEGRYNSTLSYNDRNAELVLNQFYLSFGRRINTRKNQFDIGGRVDFLYGADFFHTSSIGLETRKYSTNDQRTLDPSVAQLRWNSNDGSRRADTASLYGLSMPQLYAEMFVPLGNGITVKAGHFYSGMGVESAMSPENFFYSHSYAFMYGMPATLTGMTASMKVGRRFTVLGGFSQGWNVWEDPTQTISSLFGVKWESRDKRSSLSWMVHSGEESTRGKDTRTNYSLIYKRRLNKQLHYALEHTFGYEQGATTKDLLSGERSPARWMSLAQYLQWDVNEQFAWGARLEWFRDDGHSRLYKNPIEAPSYRLRRKDYFELTLGLNWKPTRFITIRPELRYDWSNIRIDEKLSGSSSGIFNGRSEMLSLGVDAVVRF